MDLQVHDEVLGLPLSDATEVSMEFHLDTVLQNLHCITPSDPSGEDEPYLWIFFIVVDGSTVRQRLDDPLRLSASITVRSGSGRPGNLDEAKGSSGGNIHIPLSIGQHQGPIKPMVLNLPFGTPPMTVFIPGRVITLCAAIDEESVPRDAMEAGFHAVKLHIQNRLNDFFNGLSMADFADAFNDPTDRIAAATALFNEKVDTLTSQISDEAEDVAADTATDWVKDAVDWWNPSSWAQALVALSDKDEPLGSHTFAIDEAGIVGHSLHEDLRGDLHRPQTNLGGAWYVASGYSNATVRFAPGDHKLSQLRELPRPAGTLYRPEKHFPQVARKCLEPGTEVILQRTPHFQQWQIVVNYPFMRYRYTLDGQELVGDSGTVRIEKTVSFPQFDDSKFYFIGASQDTRLVTINYQRLPVPGAEQLQRILISNNPADGNFDLLLTVVGLLPGGATVPVASEGFPILGQSIDFLDGFLERYIACVARSLNERRVRVKRTVPDQWRTPEVAWNQYEEILTQLAELQALRIYDARTIENIKQGIAGKLKLEIPK